MKCKPGDLAVVVNDFEEPKNNGALVFVLRRVSPGDYDIPVEWECEAISRIELNGRYIEPGESDFGYRDCELFPIRDPGPDAVDETLAWKEVPKPAVLSPKPQKEFT